LHDFTRLRRLGLRVRAFRPATLARWPSGSTLPRLSGEIDDTLLLLDPAGGAAGMAEQLAEMVALAGADTVAALDVGGDAVGRGDEPTLRSPLADALALAAVARLGVPTTVLVAGPGLDGELSEEQVLDVTGPDPAVVLTDEDVSPFRMVFTWHPSETTALLVAAARGLRGRVEVRDAGMAVDLTDASAGVYTASLDEVLAVNRVAAALDDTTSLDEAEAITRLISGRSEIDHERRKARAWAAATDRPDQPSPDDLDRIVAAVEAMAVDRGVDFLTFRRIAEATGLPPAAVVGLRDHLVAARPGRYVWPLWSLRVAG
jgi:hypothetical protein